MMILTLILTSVFGCQGFGRTVKVGEPFTLKTTESARVRGADVEITVIRIGRKWLANGGGESLDFSFSVKHDGKTEIYSEFSPAPITAGNYKIEIVKTEPFGDGYATFIVTKSDSLKNDATTKNDAKKDSNDAVAAEFVGKFGWHVDDSIAPVKVPMEFPKNFDGLPFYHYQSASQNSGVDMTPLLGKKVEMLKYTLKEKRTDKGRDFTVFAHLIIENGAVVGAWQTDSSDAAPGIYSFVQKKTL